MTWQIIPHTADVRLRVTGHTVEEIFRFALLGMGDLISPAACKNRPKQYKFQDRIHITSSDFTSLLIDFLSEALTLSHINKAVYCDAVFYRLSETDLVATIKGNSADNFDEDIKAVTYHEANIRINQNNELETVIIFDI